MYNLSGNGVILDRSVFSDYVFARVGFSQGFINQAGEVPHSEYFCEVKSFFFVVGKGTTKH